MKYSCFNTDSIRLMAEAACVHELSPDVATTISEDVSFRIRQIIARATKFMRHARRTKLTCADINKALKWSDCQPVFGHESNSGQRLRYSYSAEARVFRYENDEVDLARRFSEKPTLSDGQLDEARPRISVEEM